MSILFDRLTIDLFDRLNQLRSSCALASVATIRGTKEMACSPKKQTQFFICAFKRAEASARRAQRACHKRRVGR